MSYSQKLTPLRESGRYQAKGLSDEVINKFAQTDSDLQKVIEEAVARFEQFKEQYSEIITLQEDEQTKAVQNGFWNFYAQDTVNPYVALTACGPWIVTLKGAVLYDAGGYGMLGLGHAPASVLKAMNAPQAMANIMTPNMAQFEFINSLRKEIGQTQDGCPYVSFMCLNSGSESVSLGARVVDVNAKLQTETGAQHAGKTIKRLVVKGAFHGRTDKPALYSNSSRKSYEKHLASFRNENSVLIVNPYDTDALKSAFAEAEQNGWFIEAAFLEPVMGEGDPGRAVPREFYDLLRKLTKEHGSLLLVDSIQAGLRATGYLSVVDYPEFSGAEAPDLETYSKAINAGQYPLSVLALSEKAHNIFQTGLYGNTMTSNPRALSVASTVLKELTPELRSNIVNRGQQALDKLNALKDELGGAITKVQGTGMLFSCELASKYKAYGKDSVEEYMRLNGIGVIHGGENSLRFTPHFAMTEAELDLLVEHIKIALTA